MTEEPIWIMGGEQRVLFYRPNEWSQYRRALVVKSENGRLERVLEYESPPEHCPDETPSHVFKAATIEGDTAYLCTQTEVLVCDFPSFAIRRVISASAVAGSSGSMSLSTTPPSMSAGGSRSSRWKCTTPR